MNKHQTALRLGAIALAAGLLAACGGGGSGGDASQYSGWWQDMDCSGPPVRLVGNEHATPDISNFLRIEDKGRNQLHLHVSDVVRDSTNDSCTGAKLGELTTVYSGERKGKVTALVEDKQVQADKIVLTGIAKPMTISSDGKTVPAPTDLSRLPDRYQVGKLLWYRSDAADTFDEADDDVRGGVVIFYTTMLKGQQVLYMGAWEPSAAALNGPVQLKLHAVQASAKP